MYKKILLAYDGSDAGQKALLDCRDVAQWSNAELHLVAVMPSAMSFVGLEGGVYDVELEEREKRKYRGVLDDGLRRLAESGFTARGEVVTGEAIDEITKFARRRPRARAAGRSSGPCRSRRRAPSGRAAAAARRWRRCG